MRLRTPRRTERSSLPTRRPGLPRRRSPSGCAKLHMRSSASTTSYTPSWRWRGGSHRQFGGGCPVHGAPSPPLGCAPADENPAGGAATSAPGAGQPEAVGAACRDAAPLSQENNTFFNCMFLNKLPTPGAPHPALKSRNGGHAGVRHQGGLLRCPQQ